jgi:tetratricopeptide (TPR) repeat protein
VSARARVLAITAVAAAVAAAVVVGLVAGTGPSTEAGSRPEAPQPRPGAPPLSLDLGLRADREARDLRQALGLYEDGRRAEARALFARHDSLEARVGATVAAWPDGTVDRLTQLAGLHPGNAAVQLNLGTALLWADRPGAHEAWRAAAEAAPDSAYAIVAGNLLHPEYAPNLPRFVLAGAEPSDPSLTPAEQLAALARAAGEGGVVPRLVYGVALQRVGRPLSARREFLAAARDHPRDVQAQVAAAVGRFDKARPADAFSRLGPLTRRFPAAATVRFHLGLLLLWSGEVEEAKRQLERATRVEPRSPLAAEARRYLSRIAAAGA